MVISSVGGAESGALHKLSLQHLAEQEVMLREKRPLACLITSSHVFSSHLDVSTHCATLEIAKRKNSYANE